MDVLNLLENTQFLQLLGILNIRKLTGIGLTVSRYYPARKDVVPNVRRCAQQLGESRRPDVPILLQGARR